MKKSPPSRVFRGLEVFGPGFDRVLQVAEHPNGLYFPASEVERVIRRLRITERTKNRVLVALEDKVFREGRADSLQFGLIISALGVANSSPIQQEMDRIYSAVMRLTLRIY